MIASPSRLKFPGPVRFCQIAVLATLLTVSPGHSQEIEPRRWSHLPSGSHFIGGAYAFTSGDITFDPLLRIEEGEFDLHTTAVKYIHSFDLLGNPPASA